MNTNQNRSTINKVVQTLKDEGFTVTVGNPSRQIVDPLARLSERDRAFVAAFTKAKGHVTGADQILIARKELSDPLRVSRALRSVADLTLYGVTASREHLLVGRARHPHRKVA